MIVREWLRASAALLEPGQVHLYRAPRLEDAVLLDRCRQVLSARELERAQRFFFPADGDTFTTAHAALRLLAGRYLGIAPEALRFCENGYGKPALDRVGIGVGGEAAAGPDLPDLPGLPGLPDLPDLPDLRFSIAHTREMTLLAFARGIELGVDVERADREVEFLELAERNFAPAERRYLDALPPGEVAAAFFRCWTRKEAYVKALGKGLSCPLEDFAVRLDGDEELSVAVRPGSGLPGAGWSLFHLEPGSGHMGALAAAGAVAVSAYEVDFPRLLGEADG